MRRIYEAFNVRDIDCVVALTHPDIEAHPLRTDSPVRIQGRDSVRKSLEGDLAAGRTHRYQIEEIRELADGAVVVVGKLVDHDIHIDVIGVHRLKDGLNWRAHQYFSDEATLRQLGILNDSR